jgi:hypothetical protein
MNMKSTTAIAAAGALCLISAAYPTDSVRSAPAGQTSSTTPALSYADIADMADVATTVAVVRIRNIINLPPEQAVGVPAGFRRLYIEADVQSLIRGEGGLPPAISYLYDAPLDARGKVPKLKKAQVLLFARPGARPGQIQLIARDAQLPATEATISQTKAVLSEMLGASKPPRITGLGDAFHVAGTVAGESETQIFLRTENGDPVSLSILRRPGQAPHWAVALGEIVDEAARPPQPGTLLWYRLACALPPALPASAVRTLSVQESEAARADYRFVIDALGPCKRTRVTR